MQKQGGSFLASCVRLQLGAVCRRLPAALCMMLAALLLAAAAAAAAAGLLGKQQFIKLKVAVAIADDAPALAPLMRMVTGMPDIAEYAEVQITSEAEAVQMVRSGGAVAALVLPEGFLESVYRGENMPPTLVINSARPVESALLARLAQTTVRVLAKAQQGIYYTIAVYDMAPPEALTREELITKVNLRFFEWVLNAGGLYSSHITEVAAGQLTVKQHYLLCAALFFLMLGTPVLRGLFVLRGGWAARLKAAGCRLWRYRLVQLAVGFLAVLAIQLPLLAGAGALGGGTPAWLSLAPGAVLSAAFLTFFACLCTNAGGVFTAVGINFFLAAAFMLAGGGLLPRAMLPAPLAALEGFSPIGWMTGALRPLYGVVADAGSLMLLSAGCTVLLAGCVAQALAAERGGLSA